MIRKLSLSLLFLFLLPLPTLAAELTFQIVPVKTVEGPGSAVEVWFDPEGKSVNVVEGIIRLEVAAPAEILWATSSDKGSVLTMWPTPPTYSPKDKVIRFAGGVPGGFEQKSLLFRLRASPTVPEQVTFSWLSGVAYLNDGRATAEAISARSLKVALSPQAEQEIVEPDEQEKLPGGWRKILIPIILLGAIIILIIWYGYKKFTKN